MRPPFTYYGGKTILAEKIVSLLPEHEHYVEPFAGSLAVLLAKPRSRMETVNDLDGDLMTFWRVLRDQPDELEAAMHLTPHSRAEHAAAYDLEASRSDLERARRVWVLLSQGRGGSLRRTGWRFYRNGASSTYGMPDYLTAYAERLPAASARLHGVSLECRDAIDIIRDYGQHPTTLLYCDPPYVRASRNSTNYRHEMGSQDAHRTMLEALTEAKAAVVLSGYPSALYDDTLDGWDRLELPAWTGNGIRNGHDKTDGTRTEVIWSNRPLTSTLSLDFGEGA